MAGIIYKPLVGWVRTGAQNEDEDPRERDWRSSAPGFMRPKTPAGRMFDLLSRLNYMSANIGLESGRVARDTVEDTPGQALGRVLRAAGRGLAGKDKVFWEDVLGETEWGKAEGERRPLTTTLLGLGLDVALDPLTYLTFGVSKAGKGAKLAASLDDWAKLGRTAKTAEGLIDTAGMAGKSLRKAEKANRAIRGAVQRTGKSVDELAGIWRGGKAAQAQAGMRGLGFAGKHIPTGTAGYRWAERAPYWLAKTPYQNVIESSKVYSGLEHRAKWVRKSLSEIINAFTPGDTVDPVARSLNLGARRKGLVSEARLGEMLTDFTGPMRKAAEASDDPVAWQRALVQAVERPQGERGKLVGKLASLNEQIATLRGVDPLAPARTGQAWDVTSDFVGVGRRGRTPKSVDPSGALAGHVAEPPFTRPPSVREPTRPLRSAVRYMDVESAYEMPALKELGALTKQRDVLVKKLYGAADDVVSVAGSGDVGSFAPTYRKFLDACELVERDAYEAMGLPFRSLKDPGLDHYWHISNPDALAEIDRLPKGHAWVKKLREFSAYDPAQRRRLIRGRSAVEVNDIVTGAIPGKDLGDILGAEFAGRHLANPLFIEDALLVAQARIRTVGRIVSTEDFVRGVKGLLQPATDELAAQGWRTPDFSVSAWGEAVNPLEGFMGQPELVANLEHVWAITNSPQSTQQVVKMYGTLLNTWRGYALLAPSYHFRNLCSNTWQNFLAGVTDPAAYRDALQFQIAMKRAPKDGGAALAAFKIATPFGDVTGRQLKEMLFNEDLLGGFMSEWGREIQRMHQGMERLNPVQAFHHGTMKKNLAAGTHIENNARFALFFDQLGKGASFEDAAGAVRHFLFDYSELGLSTFENRKIRPITGFYRWTKNNMLLSVEQLVKQPGKYAGIAKVKHGIETLTEPGSPTEAYLPEWLAEGYAVRYKGGEKPEYFNLQNWLPAMQVAELFEDIDEVPVPGLRWALGMLAPTITVPGEQVMNKSLFFERPIQEYPGERREFLGMQLPPRVSHVLRTARPLSEANRFTQGKPVKQVLGELVFGRTYPYSAEKGRRSAAYQKRELLGQLTVAWKRAYRSGDVREAARLREEITRVRYGGVVQ